MYLNVLVATYFAIGAFVMVWVFFAAMAHRRQVKLFTMGDELVVVLTCIAAGLFWVAFVPGLAMLGARLLRETGTPVRHRWWIHARAARARG